ncbi:MAG: PilZ domain-containing protein [Methylococcaceae bacterium]|nr:PilZ domain-containing protein [Methylococcaceae bacterium]
MNTSHQPTLHCRRAECRSHITYQVFVRSINNRGQRFKLIALADNISPGGLLMRLPQPLDLHSQVFIFTRLKTSAGFAALGQVVRTEMPLYKSVGVAVRFSHTRLLALPDLQISNLQHCGFINCPPREVSCNYELCYKTL